MPATGSAFAPHSAPTNPLHPRQAKLLCFPSVRLTKDGPAISNRGLVLGGILSSALWLALILAARELWLLLR